MMGVSTVEVPELGLVLLGIRAIGCVQSSLH